MSIPQPHQEAKKKWIELWYLIHRKLGEPACARQFAIFTHIQHLQERLDDVSLFADRILTTKNSSIQRTDFEALYQFGCQLLDIWAICVAHIAPLEASHAPYNWDFHRIVCPRIKEEPSALTGASRLVDSLRSNLGNEMTWLDENFSYYRNRLIVHKRHPIDRSLHLVGDDIRLFFNLSPDWMGQEKQQELLEKTTEMLSAAPKEIRTAFERNSLHNSQLLSEYMLQIEKFNPEERAKITDLAMKYGCLSPTSSHLYSRLVDFLIKSGIEIESHIHQSPETIKARTVKDYLQDKFHY